MLQQQTLRQEISFSGSGLHSGNRVKMTFRPAPPNAGIRFRRVDLNGQPEIEALVDNVSETTRSTSISKGNVKVQTVEHVLSAFAGHEVDNAIIELDANEPPIADGSAREYSRMIEEAGIERQADKREPYKVTVPLELKHGESLMTVFPHNHLKITCTSADKDGRFVQYYSVELSPESWKTELAHARTFCFYEEIEKLIRSGLIKGGSLENAVVIREDAVLTTEPLRYPDEFVRHKILDIVGDLSLLGRPLLGHVVAVKPSHAVNCEFAKLILAQMRQPIVAAQTFAPPPPEQAEKPLSASIVAARKSVPVESPKAPVMDIMQIMKILPHRYPFLMVDKVMKIEGNTITGLKNVTINEAYFEGHFPNHPVMPGVLQLEAIAQVAGILMMQKAADAGKIAYFMSAENVKWRKPVRPGDRLMIEVELTKARGKVGKAKGVCSVEGEPVSEADVTFMTVDPQA